MGNSAAHSHGFARGVGNRTSRSPRPTSPLMALAKTRPRPTLPPGARKVTLSSINPATGELLETFTETGPSELDGILERSVRAFQDWRRRPLTDRISLLRRAASVLRGGKTKYARTMALAMGKPLAQGEAEGERYASVCDYYAEHGPAFLAPQPRELDGTRSYVRFD